MNVQEKLELFFENPNKSIARSGRADPTPVIPLAACKMYSTLYLLRRDVRRCFRRSDPVYWPGAMALLAGVDLLAKFSSGSDSIGGVGQRFKNFVDSFMNAGDGNSVYELRNALLHSFGVYIGTVPAPPPPVPGGGPPIGSGLVATLPNRFRLTSAEPAIPFQQGPPGSSLFQNVSTGIVEVNLRSLRQAFEGSVAQYHQHILATTTEQTSHFEPMFDKYGWVWICEYRNLPSSTLLEVSTGG